MEEIETYRFKKAITFRKDKFIAPEKLKRLLEYQTDKINERLKGIMVSPLRFGVTEQDGSNFRDNLVTAYWYTDVVMTK